KKIKELLVKGRIKTSDNWSIKYDIEVHSPFEKPEKFYSMVLNELRYFDLKNIQKVSQFLDASPTSGFYGDISQRKAYAKENVDKAMGIINGIIQTITKLIYSLREFDSVLDIFKKLESNDKLDVFAAEQNLRRIFLDEVDMKKGRGAMYQMQVSQGMEYVNLVDSFLTVENLKDVDDLKSNDRVKRILKGRFQEYELWKKSFKKDIVSRKEIQKQYLKSQVESLKMQLDWIKPHYAVLKQLDIKSGANNPDLLVGFDTMQINTKIRCVVGGEKENSLVTGFLDVDFEFKTNPYQVRTEQGTSFHHRFGTKITYTPYVLRNDDYEKFIKNEAMKEIDFFKDIVGDSLKAISEDLEKYLGGQDFVGKEKNPEDDDSKPFSIFEFLILPFKGMINLIGLEKDDGPKKPEFSLFKVNNDFEKYRLFLAEKTKDVYTNFKDENGMPTESPTLSLHKNI
ncbi:MAG: hypothetical protein PHT91_03945, partial [Candidatus Nanoarchaeia archaeon]|nr:hypothetical protein [Candidatus Nanoarchaeia archaeon]